MALFQGDNAMPAKHHNAPLPQPIFHEPIFSEDETLPSPTGFETEHPSDTATYAEVKKLLTKEVVAIPKSRAADDALVNLQDAYGSNHGPLVIGKIKTAKKIIFHACGDSGASEARKYRNELKVSDQVTIDCAQSDEANRPAFLFHLGDVVYNFGESQYYYDQFYDAFRNYPAPIFAIPGNHDSFVVPDTPDDQKPLAIFQRNFCAEHRVITNEARSLHRTAMIQPGVYFTLDAPFVRVIGLFSNALEDPGVISNEDGKWPVVNNDQLDFLSAQLKRIKTENYKGAVLLAVHHPPYTYMPPPKKGAGGNHSPSVVMLSQIDEVCLKEGVYPHAVLSAHAHNYQRYTRTIQFGGREIDVPFIVCGDGGHNVNPLVRAKKGQPAQEPHPGSRVDYMEWKKAAITAKELWLEKYNDTNYGYLRIHVDEKELVIGFHQVGASTLAQSRYDMVTLNLADQIMVSN
jgi:calcineurin-like phosphoesterase family protein